ncbi:MAG: NADH-quinone oxidoreductase subunit J [Acidimicrobiia bacterium]|nr:NADH-quinone oxidoreductase subunit J [Acidimicrobiia bacterium]
MSLEVFTFLLAGLIIVSGAIGVVLSRNPVHAALFLIQTLFGVAVEFLVVEAHFLAAIQVIVYAGAIVILFLFVIMLLGVDQAEDMRVEPIMGQRPLAVITGGALLGLLLAIINSADSLTGTRSASRSLDAIDQLGEPLPNVNQLAESVFTEHVFAFEVTGLLLTVAVVGAVVMARRIPGAMQPLPSTALDALMADQSEEGTSESDVDSDESVGEG